MLFMAETWRLSNLLLGRVCRCQNSRGNCLELGLPERWVVGPSGQPMKSGEGEARATRISVRGNFELENRIVRHYDDVYDFI